jgi:uncharacterized membrane protein
MRRLVVLTLILTMGHASAAFAGDTIVAAARRAADNLGKMQASAPATPKAAYVQETAARPGGGMSKGKKLTLGAIGAAAFAAIALAIDRRVEDNTPSTRGERTTKPF